MDSKVLIVTDHTIDNVGYHFPDITSGPHEIVILENITKDLIIKVKKQKYQIGYFVTYDIGVICSIYFVYIQVMFLRLECSSFYIYDTRGTRHRVRWSVLLTRDLFRAAKGLIFDLILIFFLVPYSWYLKKRSMDKRDPKRNISVIKDVCYLRTHYWFGINKAGGSIAHIAGVVRGLHQNGIETIFITSDYIETIPETIPQHVIRPMAGLYHIHPELEQMAYNIQFIRKSGPILQKTRPGFIYQRYSLFNYSGIVLARDNQIPLVIEYNGSEVWVMKNWGTRGLHFPKIASNIEDAVLHSADLVVVVSNPLKDELISRGIPENHILINPNGVDPRLFRPDINPTRIKEKYQLDGRIVVGFIGTFGPWHGIDILARTVKPVLARNSQIIFLLIGDGSLKEKMKQIIHNDGADASVVFTGKIPQQEAPEFLSACDILVSPHVQNADGSRFFGSPTKLFEYMAMGKAIVASDLEQIGEVLTHEKNALLVPPGDPEHLAEAILRLAGDPALRARLGLEARKDLLTGYTWEKNVTNVIGWFGNIHE